MGKLLGWVLVGLLVWVVWRFMVISKRDTTGGERSQ
jgi:hypothetical protein